MKTHTRVLVLMRVPSAPEETIFAADLYSGNRLEDSVYLDRDELLRWVAPIDPEAQPSVAHALSMLALGSERSMYSIPVCPARA